MKAHYLLIAVAVILFANNISAQNTFPSTGAAGVGTTTPDASSLLEIKSTSKGILIPRMTQAQRNAIVNPARGLLIFQTTVAPGFFYYDSIWKAMAPNSANNWKKNGSSLYYNSGNVGIGTSSPLNKLQVDGGDALINGLTVGLGAAQISGNTAFGSFVLASNTIGGANTAAGYAALASNVTGNNNTANGESALQSNTTGDNNTANGTFALNINTKGYDNTAVGYNANVNDVGLFNSAAFGSGSLITGSNQVRIGNGSISSIGGQVGWTTLSDGRVKKNIKSNIPGLIFINKLKPVSYNLDEDAVDKIIQRPSIKDKDGKTIQPSQQQLTARKQKEQIIYTGFVAQDVEKSAKEVGYDFSGVDAPKNDKDLYGLRYSDFVVPLVKAVQELSEKNNELEQRIEKLEALITAQTASVNTASQNIKLSPVSLGQNAPNPFDHITTINYTLPQKYSSAKMMITDKNGKMLKEVNLSGNGNGSVKIDASGFAASAYGYSLFVDGQFVASKQMILIK